jgi:hypothetical protein
MDTLHHGMTVAAGGPGRASVAVTGEVDASNDARLVAHNVADLLPKSQRLQAFSAPLEGCWVSLTRSASWGSRVLAIEEMVIGVPSVITAIARTTFRTVNFGAFRALRV